MCKKTILEPVIEELASLLGEYLQAKRAYSSQSVLHLKAENSNEMMGWIEVAKEKTSIRLDYNVLIEYPTVQNCMKFVLHGNDFVCEMLASRYGGRVSNSRYWILYNEFLNDCNHGYKEKLPTTEEIVRYIEEMSQ